MLIDPAFNAVFLSFQLHFDFGVTHSQLGSPEILIYGESVAQYVALYKNCVFSRASISVSAAEVTLTLRCS